MVLTKTHPPTSILGAPIWGLAAKAATFTFWAHCVAPCSHSLWAPLLKCFCLTEMFYFNAQSPKRQGHHHNGDQAGRRPPHDHMMCSICGRRFATAPFGVRGSRGWAHSITRPWVSISSPLTNMVHLLLFWSYLVGCKNVSARPARTRWQIPL